MTLPIFKEPPSLFPDNAQTLARMAFCGHLLNAVPDSPGASKFSGKLFPMRIFRVARPQSEFWHEIFFSRHEFLTKNASKFFLKFLSLDFVGPKKIPQNSPQISLPNIFREVLHGVGADGVGVKFPFLQ